MFRGAAVFPERWTWENPKWKSPYASSAQALAALQEGKAKAEVYISFMGNPVYANPNTAETASF